MEFEKYLHERDIYYVVNELYRTALASGKFFETHTYSLLDHRDLQSPSFKEQRRILQSLNDQSGIKINETLKANLKMTDFLKANVYRYQIPNNGKLRHLHGKYMLKIDELGINQISITDTETVSLELLGDSIYVKTPALRLRLNKRPMKPNQDPSIFFEFLFNEAEGKLLTRNQYPYPTAREFDDMLNKAGFVGIIRNIFVLKATKDDVQLALSANVTLKDIVRINKELIPLNGNEQSFQEYVKGIDDEVPENYDLVPGNQ